MFSQRTARLILVSVTIVSLAAMACSINVPLRPRNVLNILPPLPPVVQSHAPDRGEEQPVKAPIVLTFNQPMNTETVEGAFQVSPAVTGALRWDNDKTLHFVPSGEGLARDTYYQVSVSTDARAKNGLALQAPVSLRFKAVGFLEVGQVIPDNGTQDVAADTTVTIMFNRPVVPLTTIADQDKLPKPLSLNPPVTGRGEWLNTSIYVFHPDALTPGTTYTATVSKELQDATGAIMRQDFVWSFSVQSPKVFQVLPIHQQGFVALTTPISVTFNQPMDHASVEAAFSLRKDRDASGEKINGTFQWITNTLGFVPSRKLELGQVYDVSIAAGAKSADGPATIKAGYAWTFSTVLYPRILSTKPMCGLKKCNRFRAGLS